MSDPTADETRTLVRTHYAQLQTGCCGAGTAAETLGYTAADTASVPDGADLGLGCGNPNAIAALRPGETVLDLGAGGGFDCFLAANAVGPSGAVIGVDMTPEMVTRARANARKVGASNVDFRLGEIEHLPVADASVDVVLSNCVINLSPEKAQVFREAHRVLRAGGRLAISDIVAIAPVPPEIARNAGALCGCIAGAASVDDVRRMLGDAGFTAIDVTVSPRSAEIVGGWLPGAEGYVAAATISARRPGAATCCEPECCA